MYLYQNMLSEVGFEPTPTEVDCDLNAAPAILTLKSQVFDASRQTLIIQTIKQKISPEQGLEPWTVRLKA